MIKRIIHYFFQASLLFKGRKGLVVSAASSFYILITIIPLSLLLMRILGHFIGDIRSVESAFFRLTHEFFPVMATQAFEAIRGVIAGALFGSAPFTWLNLFIFLWFSLALLNSIWGGLFFLTGDRSNLSLSKHLKGMIIIAITVVMMLVMMSLPTMARGVFSLLRHNAVLDFIREYFPLLGQLLTDLLTIGPVLKFILKSTFLHISLFVIYFALLYRWFFSGKISYKVAFAGSLIFTSLLAIGKGIFLVYFIYIRGTLVKNYGDYYTSIIAIIWIYLMMCFFYYGASLCHVSHKDERDLEQQFISYWRQKLAFLRSFLAILKLYSKQIGIKMQTLLRKWSA